MTKIMDNLRTHGGIAAWRNGRYSIGRFVADACTRLYKDPGRATGTEAERGHFATALAVASKLPNDNPV